MGRLDDGPEGPKEPQKAPVADRLRERARLDVDDGPLLTEAATEVDTLKARVAQLEAAVPTPSALPDPASPEAVMLLQRALGHVAVDGEIGPRTVKAIKRLKDPSGLHAALERLLVQRYGSADQAFIAGVFARLPA